MIQSGIAESLQSKSKLSALGFLLIFPKEYVAVSIDICPWQNPMRLGINSLQCTRCPGLDFYVLVFLPLNFVLRFVVFTVVK